jgi:plastocyanin
MTANRRQLLRAAGLAAVTAGIAGCSESTGSNNSTSATGTSTDAATDTAASSAEDDGEREASTGVGASAAVAAEWTAMRARLDDAFVLGMAGHASAGASVGQNVFARFEGANGEYGAHEYLEATNEANYEGFEENGLVVLNEELAAGNVEAARDGWSAANTNLREATISRVGETGANALEVLRFGAAVNDVELLAAAGDSEGAVTVGQEVLGWWETSPAHDALEDADGEAYERLEGAMEDAIAAAESDDLPAVREATTAAASAAATGAYAVASSERVAGAGQLASYQAAGWDAAALASMGGAGEAFAHAAVLTTYRARVHDAGWVAARGETDTARTMAEDVFAHFEGADAHDPFEEANGEAYEAFESGLDSLVTAIGNGNAAGIDGALATVDDNLVAGIEALVGGTGAAVLEAEFFRARVGDAHERYRQGATDAAAGIAQSLFETFEQDELGFHEAFEEADHEGYESFEESLGALQTAFAEGNDDAVETETTAVLEELLGFETTAGSTGQVGAGEAAYMAARGFDAAGVAALGDTGRASSVVQETFAGFEAGAGGFHEALEEADSEVYEAFESDLDAVGSAADSGGDVYGAATTFNDRAVEAAYAVVGSGGSVDTSAVTPVMQDTFAAFEEARVHEMLEEADEGAYEGYEAALDEYITALEEGDEEGAATAYADATLRAQFAVVGAVDDAPVGEGSSGESGGEEETELSGGPNVVEGVPDDADHVVDMQAVAFEPAELTVSAGDTVAFAHRAGEPHNVVAREEQLPEGAGYWASGGFDSESAANEGWENGEGAVQSGQSYVRTFETAGEHPYYCVPHEMAGMEGTVVVEE